MKKKKEIKKTLVYCLDCIWCKNKSFCSLRSFNGKEVTEYSKINKEKLECEWYKEKWLDLI